ncbi:MAG: alpha/beta hydrolase [Gammaproteobacteria bacterium]
MTTTTFQLAAPAGELEVLTETPANLSNNLTMIICHPHPLFGGTMHNKVVTTLAKVANELDIPSVRFNFRGVGKSTGQYDDGVGEIDDLQTIIAWVKQTRADTRLWLAGFSFGSYVAAEVATTGIAERLISVAPPATRWHFQEIKTMPCPWLVVQGDADEVVEPEAVFAWFAAQHPQAEMIRMHNASHFFHGRLIELREILVNKLKCTI